MVWDGFFRTLLQEVEKTLRVIFGNEGSSDRLRKQLRIMYGRREIDQTVFITLRRNLDLGYYIEGEIKSLHRQALRRMEIQGESKEAHLDPQIAVLLEEVYINRARIEESRYEVKQALRVVEENRKWLASKIDAEKKLEPPVSNDKSENLALSTRNENEITSSMMKIETEANRIFGIPPTTIIGIPTRKGGFLDHLALLNQQIETARKELGGLDVLEEQLRIYESELLVLQSRRILALAEDAVHKQIE